MARTHGELSFACISSLGGAGACRVVSWSGQCERRSVSCCVHRSAVVQEYDITGHCGSRATEHESNFSCPAAHTRYMVVWSLRGATAGISKTSLPPQDGATGVSCNGRQQVLPTYLPQFSQPTPPRPLSISLFLPSTMNGAFVTQLAYWFCSWLSVKKLC